MSAKAADAARARAGRLGEVEAALARKAVREIAAQLIPALAAGAELARLRVRSGHGRGRVSWKMHSRHRNADQMSAIEEVKGDMEKPVPMDRLICGDVGYGKTEIAVRAAFKAVQDGKQVAVLVPTTLLAQQHYNTFSGADGAVPGRDPPASTNFTDAEGGRASAGKGGRMAVRTSSSVPIDCSQKSIRFKQLGLGHRRRGAALRRKDKEHLKTTPCGGGRADDVGDADPAHAGDGDHRHPRDVDIARHRRSSTRSSPTSARTTTSRSPRPSPRVAA